MRDRLTIGEVAKLTGVTNKTVRHYHKAGLLAEPDRSESGYRLYGAGELLRLRRIRRLRFEVLLQAFLHLLWLQVLVLLLEVYTVFWVLGFYASRIVLPHRLAGSGLYLHHGIFAAGFIPYDEIQHVKLDRRKAPDWGDGLQMAWDKVYLAIAGHTDVTLELRPPRPLHGFLRPTGSVNTVHLAVDEPKFFVKELRDKLSGPVPAEKEISEV